MEKRVRQLVKSPQWWKHLRPYWRRIFWKRDRMAVKKDINNRKEE